jgi:hypothetical protein
VYSIRKGSTYTQLGGPGTGVTVLDVTKSDGELHLNLSDSSVVHIPLSNVRSYR